MGSQLSYSTVVQMYSQEYVCFLSYQDSDEKIDIIHDHRRASRHIYLMLTQLKQLQRSQHEHSYCNSCVSL